MRRIIIPQEALDRHEEKLGKALLGYLKRLAEGKSITWDAKGKGIKQRDKIISTAMTCSDFWKWVYDQFLDIKILIAIPIKLLVFAKEYLEKYSALAGKARRTPTKTQKAVVRVIQTLFDYEAFREGRVLAPCDTKGTVRWIKLPSQEPKSRKKKYRANKEIVDAWDGWSLAEYVRLLDIRYCPYCNAETVGLVQRMNPKAKTPVAYSALDHILPKSKHPLLALSLYNLVPACTKCNSQLKHESDEFNVGKWNPHMPFNALHPYAHNIHKWFRFVYRPSCVDELFLDPRKSRESPLSIDRRIPLPADKQKPFDYDWRTKQYTTQYELPGSYYNLYAAEINEMIRMEMICTPTFEKAMREKGLSDEDFNVAFRRASLDPREINKHRFAKLIIDLYQQIGRKDPQNLKETGHA